MATRAQFRHEDVATVPRGWKVRTKTQASGHQVRIAYPPGPRRRGAGRLISILHPEGENPGKCAEGRRLKAEGSNPRGKIKTREQVEKMQAKAVKFLRDVVKDDDKADEIESMTLEDYAAKKKITLSNPQKQRRQKAEGGRQRRGNRNPKRRRRNLEQKPLVPFERSGPGDWHIFHKPRGRKAYPLAGPFATKAEAQKFHRGPYRGKGQSIRYVPAEGYSLNPPRRRNQPQDAAALYQKFHGKPPKEVLELQESAAIRGEYTALGDLVELVVKSPAGDSLRIGFAGEKVKLASSPNGGQLYFLGGNQALDGNLARFKTDATKDLVNLGEAESIVYRAAKDFTGFKSSDWEHEFGEESGERPSAFYDKLKKRIFLVGGTYRVERPGIVD